MGIEKFTDIMEMRILSMCYLILQKLMGNAFWLLFRIFNEFMNINEEKFRFH